MRANSNIAAGASATASLACVPSWHEDFREDLARVDVPTLVIHGDDDRIVPIVAAGQRTAKLIAGARLVIVKGGPHRITWTHADDVNAEILSFLAEKTTKVKPKVASQPGTYESLPSASLARQTQHRPRRIQASGFTMQVNPKSPVAAKRVSDFEPMFSTHDSRVSQDFSST